MTLPELATVGTFTYMMRWGLEGEITMGTEEETVTLKAGGRIEVPAGTRHWAEVENEGITYVCGSKV